jgi:hypothetical protein
MKTIRFDDSGFWRKIKAGISREGVIHYKILLDSGARLELVALSGDSKMEPFVRTKEELYLDTIKKKVSSEKYKFVINGPTYGLSTAGKVDAAIGNDPIPAVETEQEGRVIKGSKIIGGRASNMYWIAQYNPKNGFFFGRGRAPLHASAAVGNLGPLIINGLPFGKINKYDPPNPSAKKTGEPKTSNAKSLIQRSNARFSAMMTRPSSSGKIILGYKKKENIIFALAQKHGSFGISVDGLRDILLELGVNSAVYLDGSDSVTLMVGNDVVLKPGSNKNETAVTAIGFK